MYYFTVSSLPYLQLEGERAITTDEFLEQCRPWLKARHMELLENAHLLPEESDLQGLDSLPATLASFYRFEAALRNELVHLRAAKLGWDIVESVTESDEDFSGEAEIAERARDAFGQDSPLDGERQLDRARWMILDRLSVGHYFDIDTLIIYYLKLLILERAARMNADDGAAAFEAVYDRAALKINEQNLDL